MTSENAMSTDGTERLEGYPDDALDHVLSEAKRRYEEKVDEHGPGKNWLNDDPEYHLWRAVVNLTEQTDDGGFRPEAAGDALNHILFAIEIERGDWDA